MPNHFILAFVEKNQRTLSSYDRHKKFALYQAAGVPEYWLMNYWDKTVECFILAEGSYTLAGIYRLGDTIVSPQLSGFEIAIETIFNF